MFIFVLFLSAIYFKLHNKIGTKSAIVCFRDGDREAKFTHRSCECTAKGMLNIGIIHCFAIILINLMSILEICSVFIKIKNKSLNIIIKMAKTTMLTQNNNYLKLLKIKESICKNKFLKMFLIFILPCFYCFN